MPRDHRKPDTETPLDASVIAGRLQRGRDWLFDVFDDGGADGQHHQVAPHVHGLRARSSLISMRAPIVERNLFERALVWIEDTQH